MNEKPREITADEQKDLLEQIITQGLDQLNAPVQTEDAPGSETPPAPKQEDAGEAVLPTGRKNRRSAVCFYLAILFGAAFLMLLLAYYIQQRNNAAILDDLRSATASREELLDEIRELESQVKFLQSVDDNWMSVYLSLEEKYARSVETNEQLSREYDEVLVGQISWSQFWVLEQCYQAGDYESCAALLLLLTQSEYGYETPAGAEARQAEILDCVISRGLLDGEYDTHISDYEELIDSYIAKQQDYGPTG